MHHCEIYFKYMIKACLLKVDILVCECDKVRQQRMLFVESSRVFAYQKIKYVKYNFIKFLNRKCIFVLCPDKILYACLKLKCFEVLIALSFKIKCILILITDSE